MAQDSASRTVAIELVRTGLIHNHTLSPDETYVALCGDNPKNDFKVSLTQQEFNRHVRRLRYGGDDEGSVEAARKALEQVVRNIFEVLPDLPKEAGEAAWLHLRLVVTPKELGLLPFELSPTPSYFLEAGRDEGEHLLLNGRRQTTLTREVRQASQSSFDWPRAPRVLYAWAEPGGKVPHDEHLDALMNALRPWAKPYRDSPEPVPDLRELFCECRNATLDDIREELARVAHTKRPYTHVHLLAHGTAVVDEEDESKQFALALHKKGAPAETDAVDGKRLADALRSEQDGRERRPGVVVISACDGGNEGSIITPGASLAHTLHTSGIPYVLASQFPLTKSGSVTLTSGLYPRFFRGEDPRCALHHLRRVLRESHPGAHDWASLVAYARFPEDLGEQLKWVRLAAVLQEMRTVNAWADHVLKYGEKIETTFEVVGSRLDRAIEDLEGFLDEGTPDAKDPKRMAEHFGLLGSAYKRKAEHLYRQSARQSGAAGGLRVDSRAALEKAREQYRKGHDSLLSDHWTGCQYLSLTAATRGTLAEESERWIVIRFAAAKALEDEGERIWALGTMAELHLLKPLTVSPERFEEVRPKALEEARRYLTALDDAPPTEKDSTARQLERYIHWWPDAFPSEGMGRLRGMAAELRPLLPRLEDLR